MKKKESQRRRLLGGITVVSFGLIPPVSVTHEVGLAAATARLATAGLATAAAARVVRVPIWPLLATAELALAGFDGESSELRHVQDFFCHLHSSELVSQQKSLLQPLEGLHRRRLRHKVGDEGEGVVGQCICRVHKLLTLRDHTSYLEIELRSGKPQDGIAGPEIRELAALLISRLLHQRRLLLLHYIIHEILQEGVVVEKIHATCSGLPVVVDELRCGHVECKQ